MPDRAGGGFLANSGGNAENDSVPKKFGAEFLFFMTQGGMTLMYDKVSTSLNFVEREKEILEFWRAHGIVEKTFTEREGARPRPTAGPTSATWRRAPSRT